VAEVTSLGLVQMTRKRVGEGLLEAFSETCEHCHGCGVIIHSEPVDKSGAGSTSEDDDRSQPKQPRRKRGGRSGIDAIEPLVEPPATPEQRQAANAAIAAIHRAAALEKAEAEAAVQADRERTDTTVAAEPVAAEPVAAEPVAAEPAAEAPSAEHATDPVTEANGAPAPVRRRRRAASRPAGPPVPTS
jgi:ribonuclease E